jgi:hypothetical protein
MKLKFQFIFLLENQIFLNIIIKIIAKINFLLNIEKYIFLKIDSN